MDNSTQDVDNCRLNKMFQIPMYYIYDTKSFVEASL